MHPLPTAVSAALIALALCSGCATTPRARIDAGSATAPRDNGTPAKVESGSTITTATLPAGSTITFTPAGALEPVTATIATQTEVRSESRIQSATTGTIDTETAQHRIDSDRKAGLARTQMLAGIGLMVAGALVAFALPPAFRWPQAGLYVAAAGLVLVILRDPPTWLLAALGAGAVATVIAYFSSRKNDSP